MGASHSDARWSGCPHGAMATSRWEAARCGWCVQILGCGRGTSERQQEGRQQEDDTQSGFFSVILAVSMLVNSRNERQHI